MATSNDNLRKLYQNGLKHFSLPDFDTFERDMKDEVKRQRFYTNMQAAYSLPDFDTFSKDIGVVATDSPTPVKPATQTPAQSQERVTSTTVRPLTDTTPQLLSVQQDVQPIAQPAKSEGWEPSPMQHRAFQMQMDEANARLKKLGEDFHQRMEGIDKGNRPGAFMGEREFNPQTGQMETHYYTQQGERVGSRMEQSRRNSAHHQWWENNTEAGRRSKEQRLQREFDARLSGLWQRHNPAEGETAAEQAWSAAEKRQGIDRNRISEDIYHDRGDALSNAAFLGGPENHTMNAAANSHRSKVAHFTNFDLDRLMNESWDNLGEDGQKALIDDCYQMLRYRNPGTDELVLYNQAKEFARQQSDLRLYNLAVEKNLPKGNLEYLMRKIGDMNLLMNISKGLAVSSADGKIGDMAAYEAANEQYRQDGHRILDVTGMVAGFALDPTTWLSAGVGSAATRGAMWAGGRWLAGRGASAAVTQAATRQFATSMTGRIVGGIAGGSANFGTFEGVKEMENQFAHGGKVATMDENGNLLREGRYVNEGYSAGAVAGQFGHGLLMGGAVGWLGPVSGNVSDKLVRASASTVGKVATRAGVYTGATLAEGTIFSVPEWIEDERDAMDVWNDNMAMMVGFKAKHMLKSAGGVLGDLKASFDSPTNGQKNRLDFESRLRQRMDAPSDGGMGLTEDEKAELKRYGYDLRDLVESSERTGDAAEGSLIAQNAPEIVSRLTDMVTDPRISEAARAKMYYFATGRRLPMSTVMRGELIEDGDGGFIVESQGANGVITSRSFKSHKAADLELERIKRQTELNSIEIGERYQQTADFENRLQEACRTVAAENGWNMVEVYRTCEEARRNHLRGGDKQFDEVQQNILRKVTEAMGEFEETGATDAMRGRINEKYGVDIDGAIRKEANRRTQQEQTAIDEYIAELIPDKAKEPNPVEDAQAEDITNQKLLSDEPAEPQGPGEDEPIDPRFDNSTPAPDYDPHQPNGDLWPTGRAVMKFQDRPVEVLSGRVVMMEDGSMVDKERSDASIVIRDLATGEIEMVSPDAILSYEAYPETLSVEEVEAMQGQGAEAPQPEVEPQSKYTSGQIKISNSDGTETRGVLTGYVDENGNHEYYVEGDLQHLHYASEQELNNILSEYQPDEVEGEATAGKPTAPGTKTDEKDDSDVSDVTDVADEVHGAVSAVAPTETPEEAPAGLTALERLPKNEKGEPIFEKAESPEAAWDALVEFAEGDTATAKEIADTMAEEKRKAYEKAQKQKPKGKTPTEILASKKAITAGLAQAEQEYNLWQQMANVEQRRQDAIRAQQEAEARQIAAERAEAKNDLQKVLYQAVFKGGSQQLEEMFDALPAKAQRAILSTAFRDMDSPFAGKMLPEIQSSIAAFNQLMNDPTFAAAKKMEEVLRVVEGFKRSIQLDDRFEQYMPADNFSNFALHLAAMYKANDMSQSTLTSYFNQMFDLAQGKKAATLFEEADTTEYPLADVIKQVLNIDYKPAKNGNNNVANGGADVALRNQDGQGGELRGNEPPASGEQNPTGTEPSNRGAGTSDDSRAAVEAVKTEAEPEPQAPATVQSAVEAASAQVNTEPTPAQAEAGNYKKGHVTIGEFDITIENPAGSVRKGVDADGKEWSNTMANTYGYIKGTEGVDGDHIDVFLHSDMDQWNGRKVFVVDQTNTDGSFDEHKVMLGFNDKDEAMTAYLANYDKTWADTHPGLRISETNIEDFNKWVQASHRKTKPFADYTTVRKEATVVIVERGAPEAAKLRQKSSRLEIEGAEKLSAERAEAVERYVEGHYCAPIRVVADEADIRESGLSDVAVAQMMAALTEEDVPAVYCREDKKIYIFAGHKDINVGSTLAHENAHALADAMPDDEEKARMLEAYCKALLESPKTRVKSQKIWDAIKGDYPDGEAVEEFLAYTFNIMHAQKNAAEIIGKVLDGELKKYIFNNFLAPIYYGYKTATGLHTQVDPGYRREQRGRVSGRGRTAGDSGREAGGGADTGITAAEAAERTQISGEPKGETKQSDQAAPVAKPKPKKRKWIIDEDADEFDSLRKDLRSHFGKDGDIVQEAGAEYGKPKPKQMDAEVLRMGTRMTYLMMKGGLRSFSDYCEAMKDELPDIFDDMRPHLKSLYAAAQNMEEVIELGWDEEMDDRKTVKAFDVYNFDKPGAKDIIATAQHAVDENASQQQTDKIIQTLKDQRNEQRKKEADETSADTETIIDKAETTASQVESKLEAANSEEDAERLSRSLDKELEEVNKQLALLGYYEADPVDKDFFAGAKRPGDYNEAYGYMRNAERKAVQDAHRLATQLAADLGITIDPKDKVRKAKYGFGSKIARSNVAPAGGEVYITLPLAEGRELSIWLSLDKNEPWRDGGREDRTDEDLMLTGIMYRVENPGAGGMSRYVSGNHNTRPTIPYDELLSDIRRLVRTYLPDEQVKPATPLAPQPGEDIVDMAKRVASDKETKTPAVESQLAISDLFGGLFNEQTPQPAAPAKKEIAERKSKSETSTSKPQSNEKTDVQPRTEGTGRGRQQPRPDEPLGEGAKHEDERTDGGRMAQRSGVHPVSDSDRGAGVSGLHSSERGVTTPHTPAVPKNTRNNHAERGTDYAPKGEKARIDANIAALELAKKLLASSATATPQEMAILRRYSGWGGLGAAFNEGSAWAPNPINKRLREALTPEEYQAAVMSRNSAYYTPAAVIDAMWDVAKALGFKGGNIVEGSAGIGNIIGLMPTDISERSNIHAVEIDPTTGGILSLLYPDAQVEVQGFEQTRIANGSVDLAITNVPFVTDLHVMDESGDSDLSKKFRDIHDFCIAKNVRKLREGGIGIFITSSGTLDKSQKLRTWLVGDKEGNADVVGVFRMNNQTFGGTAATSDIIVVRKRVNGRKSANAIDISTVTPARTATFTDARGKTKDLPLYVNRYFIEHPEHMGGEMFFGFEQGDTYRPTSIGLFPTRTADQAARMAAWVQHLADMDWSKEQGKAATEQTSHINEALGEGVKEGSMVTDSEGNLCVARMSRAVPLALNKNKIKGRTKEECFKDYTEIKSALADVLKYQTEHDDDAGLQPLLDRLNRAYDTFVQRYGNLNKNNNLAWLRNDVDFSSIVALETYSEKGNKDGTKIKTYGKTDIFSRRVVEKDSEPTPKNVKDGIIASIYKYGRIDTEYLATQLGKSQDDVKQEIVESGLGFVDPTTGQMEVSYEYLSGNVREKLRQAREANEAAGGAYDANIKALEAVVPMNIPAHLIEFALGSSWIEPQLYERYVKERTELDVKLTNAGGTWHMAEPWNTDKPKNTEMGVRSEAFGILIPGHKLIEAALTNKTISVSRTVKDSDGGSHTETDPAATTACATKVDEIRQDFKDWAREQMQNDPALSMRMEEKYNEKFNNSVPKSIPDEFVPEHFGGAATTVGGRPFKLRPHQAKAVIRATTQPVLLAHEVGTGKTYTLITTAMEMRRLGTARKPMIVVQNATVGQFVASAKALYPNAKVLTLEDADRNAEGRRAFYAKIKFNDWDMIVVPQSVFERIPDSIERQTQFIQDKIEEKMLVLEQMKEADPDGRSMIVRAAEREISRLEDEMSQLASGEPQPTSGKKKKDAKKAAITRQNAEVKARELLDRATDDVEDFDSMGIDAILVDEAHEYKHLGFATAMQRGVKGVDPSPSKKSQGVFLKAQAVLEKTGGKNVVFATGTPISNTAAEIWTFMRYLIPSDVMKEYDIYYFDDFVRNFGNIQQMLEFKTNGKYDEVNRFAGYFNLPELVRIWSTVADTVLTREAGGVSDKIPEMEGGKAQDIFLPQTRALRSIMKFVKDELKRYEDMTGKEKKENSHIPLVMYGIAKAAAVDARLVQSDAEDDPKSKTNEAVRQTLRSLEETKDYKGTVAIFADNYQNKASGFNLYEDIRKKLIAAGVPEEQVVVMKSGMTVKKKLEIFDKVNAGEVRVVMGSTFTLGTGVNIQERLHTLIHLDAPNRPMDYTQRNGRILRQGNLHNTWGLPVRVLRFGVEDSLDVTAYQRLKTKGAIADSIMNGKQLMANSMENRTLEEDQDLFGDITAQLSGSEYAMLKNQIEKEVRKLRAAEKNWKADQTYIHNRKRQITGQNRETEKRIADDKGYLEKVEAATIGDITVGKLSFPSVDAMEDFFTEQNKKKAAMQEEVRTSGYSSRPATSDITISVGGFDFKIHTEITKEMKHQQGDLFATAPAKMTYSCPELGIDAMPVRGNAIKNAVLDIIENVVSGKDFRERIAHAENYLERNNAEFDAISKRDGLPFKDAEALAKAEEKLAEYEELMKAEMAAKEAKYAEMDKAVEAASGIELTEEDSEPTASEPVSEYSAENANFASSYETKDGKTVRYTSENPEAYGGLFDFDFSNEVPGAENATEEGRVNRRQQSNPPLQRRNAALLDTNASARLNEANGEYCALERKFRESNYMEFTSAEKVESADDVAFIFEELENASVENVFVVMTKRGVPTVMHISIGGFNWSAMNAAPVKLAYDRIKPDKVYFVHNHPSGALNCSPQDVNCLKQIEGAIGKKAEGVIMDLKSGKYGTFDSSGTGSSASHDKAPAPAAQRRLRLYAFDRHVFNPDYQPSEKMNNAQDVAKFLSSHRLGDRSKVSVLVCNNQNQIVANIHTTHVSIDSKGLADDIIRAIGEFGGMHAFLYGDFEQSGMVAYRNLTQAVKERSGGVYNLLDVVRIEGNHTWSARDNGYVYEPGSEYGASPEAKSSHAEKLAKKFNTPIQLVTDAKELTSDNAERQARMRRSKGFYDPATGKVVVVLPNNANVEDVAETVFHEVVAHKGLREMLGDENYDAFCDEVYNHLKDDLKEEVDRETTRRFEREPEKGYEHHRRVAVDELFGRMAEKGFEDFTKAERGIWAKLKAKVLEAINKFLGSLKLPKWVKLGDNELRYMLWRSHEKLRTKGDYVDMARDAAKREELGLNRNDAVRIRKPVETTADKIEKSFDAAVSGDLKGKPLEVGKLTQNGRAFLEKLSGVKMKDNVSFVLNPSDLVHIYRRHYGKNEKDGRNIPLTKEDIRQISEIVSSPDRVVFGKEKSGNQRNMFFFLKEANDGSYNLMEVYSDKKGNLTAKSFFKSKEGVSQRAMLLNESSTLTSVTDGATLLDVAKLPKFFDNPTIAEEESFEYRFRDGETGDIWKDQSVGLQERITNAAIRLSNNQSGDLTLRNDAQKAVVNNLQSLLHSMRNRRGTAQSFVGADRKVEAGVVGAMNAQAMFDRATVKRVSDLARILMQNGYLSGMTSGEMQRLLSVVKNATAMHDISDSVQKIMDIMIGNQLRNAEGALRQLLSIRGSKVDARGVEVQGVLDVDGQRTMEVVKKAMSLSEDDITDRIAEALNRMGDPDQTIADQAALEYAGLNMALDYVQNIANSKAEEKTLRDSLKTAKEDRDAGRMTDDAYKQFVEATEDAIRKNKVERAEAYFNLVGRLSDSLRESIENAKAFREAEKARVSEIHHNANSDMEGRPTNEHHKDNWKDKFVNNGFVQFLFAPLGTFDQILRVFGNKSANGEGYLWNRFMRGWVDCRNKELLGVKEKFARLDEKAAELFGKGKTWGNLIRMEAKMPKATVSFWDGGEMRDHELTQGNLLYIYMVDKMTDGRMKLRRMGITEDDITRIENFLDPRFKALGDWLQDEFLVDTRNEYNETHKRMFGASMAAIENYFPLKILANARVDKEEDVNQQNRPDGITTKTGSIIKRRVNNLALDITGADVLSVILDHITQMEHWNAYAEWNRDLNTLRTYKRFRNQVINMTTVYGGGRKLWENFNDLCLMAAGEYRPPVSKLNKSAVNLAKGVTAAKVSFRMYTALKQLLSAPAYAPEVSTRAILKSIANPYGDFKWCLENMPIFRERWHSRISGDPRLLKSDMDWKMWRSRIMELSSRIGMTPNAFVDAVTVSIGARAMYETRLKQYLKEGYPTDAAEKRAMQDATILFNQTQQSSESPFLSTMQVDKDWLSTLFTVFRNSSMSYTRQEFDAMRNLKRNLTPGQRAKSIEFMTKQILRDWDVDTDTATDAERDQAQGAAKKRFRRQIKKDVLRLATFGFILELAWNLGPYLPYIIFGNDEDEKENMWYDALTHAYFGSIEGLTGGDVMSSFGNMWASGEWNWNQLSKDMPLASDINTIGSKYVGGKNAEAMNDILNLVVQMGVGMNPQSITDTAIAITDACGDDPALSHEAAIFIMRVLQVPQSQIDKMYFDEVDLTGEEASKLTPAQLAQRYAEYKVKRGTPLAPWSWGDEERLGKYNDLAADRMKERLDAQGDATVIEAYADFEARYKAVSEKAKEAKELMKTDYAAAAQAHAALQQAPDFGLYQRFGALDKQLGRISKMWLTAKTSEEATLVASTLSDYRAAMVRVLQAETVEDQQSAMSELTTLMNDFYTKYQGMQPKRVP